MHYLHKILVYIPDVIAEHISAEPEDLIKNIRSYAERETNVYYKSVFDWRETQTAGCWESRYPNNVLYAKDDVEQFVKELEDVRSSQKEEIDLCVDMIKKAGTLDLEQLTKNLWHRKIDDLQDPNNNLMTAYYFRQLAGLLYGDYRCDSYFYNIIEENSRIYDKDIAEIKENPENWALVFFDCHG